MLFKKTGNTPYYIVTLAGILAIILWASNIAFSKSTMEMEGNYNAAFYIYFYSAFVLFIIMIAFQKRLSFFKKLKNLSLAYYMKTGIFFILNNVLLFIAIGMARKNEELIIVTLLNYTWPIMIYVIGIPLFKLRISAKTILPGVLLSFSGIMLALLQGYNTDDIEQIIKAGDDNILAYVLAFLTATSWAIYSNLTVKYSTNNDMAGIPVIFLISSLFFLLIQGLNGQITTIHLNAIVSNTDLLYIVLGPTSLGYLFWYIVIKKGNKNLATSLSFFIPLLSLLFIRAKFHIQIGISFWLAVILLISGSYLCYQSFRQAFTTKKT
jgi:drug/metabolite transporter (DMT)-like permease